MALRDQGSSFGSLQAGGDSIPREYHRKVLKKIAQLTKVIYTLNTKNDENEHFIAELRATHDEDVKRILSDSTRKLQWCKEQFSLEKKAKENKIISLEEVLEATEKERNQLEEEQASYKSSVKEKLASIESQYSAKVLSLTNEITRIRTDQTRQLKEVSKLHEELRRVSDLEIKDIKSKYDKEIEELREKLSKESMNEASSLNTKHLMVVERLKEEFAAQMEAQKLEMTKNHEGILATEKKMFEDRTKSLQLELVQREENLKDQISTLSNDLRVSRDKLALSEQKVRDLLSQFEEGKAGSVELRTQLKYAEEEAEKLRVEVREVKTELDISKELYQQQSADMKVMASNLGKLEGIRVSNEGTIENLHSQISTLQENIKLLEGKKNALESSQLSANEQQTTRIRYLEKELEKCRKEKQETRVQFAREIEAAHAQLGERESQLTHDHLKTLKQLRDEHQQALLNAKREKDEALEELRKQMLSEKERELLSLKERLENEKAELSSCLSDKRSELELLQEELKRLESQLARKEQGLGSAASSLEKLNEKIKTSQKELIATRKENEEGIKERNRLMSTIGDLKERIKELNKAHQNQLAKSREKLEDTWKERLKQKCTTLREELSLRHGEDSRSALAELATLKDREMKQAQEMWETNRKELLKKIFDLEKELEEVQSSNSEIFERARLVSNNQLDALRSELEEQNVRYVNLIKQQKQSHSQELEMLQTKFSAEKKDLSMELEEQHAMELRDLQHANKLAVEALREMLGQQRQEMLEQARLTHKREMAEMRVEILSEYEKEKERLNREQEVEIQHYQKQIEVLLAERKKEVNQYESRVSNLNTDIERKDDELIKLRDKVNSLTVTTSNIRKELEMKGQEILSIRREANTILQQREHELSASHSAELEALATQHKHQSHMLLADFNNAKTLFVNKIQDLEKEVAEWEEKYRCRDSKPEDLETIKELSSIAQQQKQKIKDLIAEKRVFQLELMNREKNYNQVFNANPCVGVLNPLGSKHKKHGPDVGSRYPSAPSLMSPSLEADYPLPHIPPNAFITSSTAITTSTSSINSQAKRESEIKPKRLTTLKDSPLTQHKFSSLTKEKKENGVGPPFKHPSSIGNQKHTMIVQ